MSSDERNNVVIGIVLVSHSKAVAEGTKELAGQMTQGAVPIATAGGTAEGNLGTSADLIQQAIQEVYSDDGVLIIMDLGSAVMSAEVALEMLAEEQRQHVLMSDAPFVEGAVVAAVEASIGRSLTDVAAAALAAREMAKVVQG
jgi:PTS hybrid protein